jgi:hypothetical protein
MVKINFSIKFKEKRLSYGVNMSSAYKNKRRSTCERLIGALALLLVLPVMVRAQQSSAQKTAPWLDIPASWSRVIKDNVLILVPGDLPPGAVLMFMIEPPVPHQQSLDGAYQKALSDLGPWKPVGQVQEQTAENDWRFRYGVGVTQLEGVSYTALTAVALRRDLLARFWMLADSDATYNRYQATVLKAISSVQDIKSASAAAAASAPAAKATGKLDPAFGKGLSGVYVGTVRSVRAGAAVQTYIDDYEEIDVFFPDGTYRRRLPIRGLNGDLTWERRQQLPLWGSWQQQGSIIIVRRGNYQARYTLQGQQLIDERGRAWYKVKLPAAQRIDGVYARADFRDAGAPRLILRADGSYEDRGEFLRMVSSSGNLVEPDGDTMLARLNESEYKKLLRSGSGTYRFENFSITLRAQDGRVWQINAFVPSTESCPKVKQMVINGYKLQRD